MSTIIIVSAAFVGAATLAAAVVTMLRPSSSSAAEDRLEMLTGSGKISGGGESSAQESLLTSGLDDTPNVFEQMFARIMNVRLTLEQAGATISPPQFLAVSGGLACAGVLATVLTSVPNILAPGAGLTLAALPFGWLWYKRKKRLNSFAKQLPEALELISRALRAGHSLAAGIHLVSEEMSSPIAEEFHRCYEEQNLGIPLEESLEEMAERVPNLDLRFFVTAVLLQRQTGGDLAEILDKIGRLVRQRFQIWGQIQSLTGEGRLSGIVLLALPPVLFLVMWRINPEYTMTLFNDPMGVKMLVGALVMQFVGALVIRKIVNIKV